MGAVTMTLQSFLHSPFIADVKRVSFAAAICLTLSIDYTSGV